MKYKVGDKVKIREDLDVGNWYGSDAFIDGMEQYKGKIATITAVDNKYNIDIDDDDWFWTEEMFEDVNEVDVNKQVRTVDVGFHLEYCGHRVIKNVYYGGYAHDHEHIFCTTSDYQNQYTLPVNSIDFIIPHED